MVFICLVQFLFIWLEVYIFYDLLLNYYLFWLLDYYLFYDWFLHLFDDFFCNVDRHLNNLLYPSLPCLQSLNYLLLLRLLLWNITTLETTTKHTQFQLTLLLTTILSIWFLINLNWIILLVESNTNFFGRTANQRHYSSCGLLLLLVDVNWHWNFHNDVFLNIDRYLLDCCLVLEF